MQCHRFHKTRLASCLSLALASGVSPVALGQQTQEKEIEVIQVSGIRSSLVKSMDVKRSSSGVVDAITAEDIGKFPDANLAESLQRITGVSIDRSNSEGSQITVRGFGPEFNLVTLNGRQMPTTGGRSFDFADIATEGVSGVEVYKTARASAPSGGIGATVNITTARPLAAPGLNASVGVKAVHSDSDTQGDKVTPEISAILSNTFRDNTLGFLLSTSYQKLNARSEFSELNNWIPNVDLSTSEAAGATITDNRSDTSLATWYPQNAGFGINEFERERLNAQGVVQFKPRKDLTLTLDYTYSRVDRLENKNSFGVWFNNGGNVQSATINENGTYTQVAEVGGDYATNLSRSETQRENTSLGLNIEWQVDDQLTLTFDGHSSNALSEGKGLGNDAFLIIGNTFCTWCGDTGDANFGPSTANIDIKTADFTSADIPIWGFNLIDAAGNPQAELQGSDIGSLFGAVSKGSEENDMNQARISASWVNDGNSALARINVGASYTDMTFTSLNAYSQNLPAGWWNWSAVHFPDEMFTRVDISNLLNNFAGAGNKLVDYYYTADFDAVKTLFETIDDPINPGIYNAGWPQEVNGQFASGPVDDNDRVNEETLAVYVDVEFETELWTRPLNITAGLRYEATDVTANSLITPSYQIQWVNGNEWEYLFASEQVDAQGTGKTRELLPNLDINLELNDDLLARLSLSRTMARPGIEALRSGSSFDGNPLVNQRRISEGDPGLQPYLSDNLDVSLEYYYDEGSYASIGYYRKQVDNFIVNTTTTETRNGITDPYLGALANEARNLLIAAGTQPTDQAVHDQINSLLGNEAGTPIAGANTDPLAEFAVSRDANVETGNLWGWELALQHMFGESGFGLAVNATFVYGDIEADRNTFGQQFALPGLSDSANVSAIYENHGVSARLSYNWRDEFLSGFDQHSSPVFTESYGQWDLNINYAVTERFTLFFEALNLTEEVQRSYVRYEEQFLSGNQYGARYNLGARYSF